MKINPLLSSDYITLTDEDLQLKLIEFYRTRAAIAGSIYGGFIARSGLPDNSNYGVDDVIDEADSLMSDLGMNVTMLENEFKQRLANEI